jgi:hypothetical protein
MSSRFIDGIEWFQKYGFWDTDQVRKLSFLSPETGASLGTAGMILSEMNDYASQFERDVNAIEMS